MGLNDMKMKMTAEKTKITKPRLLAGVREQSCAQAIVAAVSKHALSAAPDPMLQTFLPQSTAAAGVGELLEGEVA